MTADDWPAPPVPGDPSSRDYLRSVLALRPDVDTADAWAIALRMSAHRNEVDVHRDVGLRLANGWSLDDIDYSLRVIG